MSDTHPRSFKLSAAKRALLETMRQEQALEAPRRVPIPPREDAGPARLASAQLRLWFLYQLEGGSATYNVPFAYRLRGPLAPMALENALNRLVERHEILRTRFITVDGEPRQEIEPALHVPLEIEDLTRMAEANRLEAACSRAIDDARRPFDLTQAPLLRTRLLQLAPDDAVWTLVLHHNIFDEWSMEVLFTELAQAYAAEITGAPLTLPPLPIQYADYAEWQAGWLESDAAAAQLDYWKKYLAGVPDVLDLPFDHSRPAGPTYRGQTAQRSLGGDVLAVLQALARSEGTTSFAVTLAAFQALLHRISGQADLLVGAPVANRDRAELAGMVGFLLNMLPLRADFSAGPEVSQETGSGLISGNGPGLRAIVRQAQRSLLGAFEAPDLPFERLVEALNPPRDLSRHPLFQAAFVLHPASLKSPALSGLELTPLRLDYGFARFDLTLFVTERSDGLDLRLETARDLFEPESGERMLGWFETLLRAALAEPDRPIAGLPLMTPAEQRHVTVEWNATTTDYPRETTLAELFAAQVAREPDALALEWGETRLSYAELDRRSDDLSRRLVELGAGPGGRIGLSMERSPEMVVAMLAAVKLQAAYVPLDPSYPQERLDFMIQDTGLEILVTADGPVLVGRRSDFNPQPTLLDLEAETKPPSSLDPAYIMYTSGSTGAPKGIVIPQRAVTRLVIGSDYLQAAPNDRIAQGSNMSFDAATFEVWGALLNGACLVGVPQDVLLDPAGYARFIRQQRISLMFVTTALFNTIAAVMPDAFRSVDTLMFGGEAVTPDYVRRVLEAGGPRRLLHVYGPTESTTFATWHPVTDVPPGAATLPIGEPIANTTAYVLDERLEPLPPGLPGELYLGGDGLALGYWQRPELTAEKFIPDPFAGSAASEPRRLYRTGDRARRLPDGAIEFLGRVDFQVKLRGFRIEPGEIETALAAHPQVRQAVVVLRRDPGLDPRLVAYWTGEKELNAETRGHGDTEDDLRSWLAVRLPPYMIPSAFVRLDDFPLTANGKIDRQALPAPSRERPGSGGYLAPGDAVEERLCVLWGEILGADPVGVNDNFFALGGHSLLAVHLFGRIESELGVRLPLATLFTSPTVAELAGALRSQIEDKEQPPAGAAVDIPNVRDSGGVSWSALVPIRPHGDRPAFYCVHNFGGETLDLLPLAQALGDDQPFFGLQALGLDGESEPHTTIPEMAAYYVEAIRRQQPHGPYYLGGYCFGGVVAYQMACQLAEVGESVALLAAIDASAPGYSKIESPLSLRQAAAFFGNLPYWLHDFFTLDRAETGVVIRRRFKRIAAGMRRKLGLQAALTPLEVIGDHVHVMEAPVYRRNLMELHMAALLSYRTPRYGGVVTAFRVRKAPLFSRQDPRLGWGRVAAGVDLEVVPGAHHTLLTRPYVDELGRRLRQKIDVVIKP